MNDKIKIAVFGDDARQTHLSRLLCERGFSVSDSSYGADAVVFPVFLPCELRLSVPEIISAAGDDAVVFAWQALNVTPPRAMYNFAGDEALTVKNAYLTAEGALSVFMKETEVAVCGSRVLVIGTGRVALAVRDVFSAMGASVTVMARRNGDVAIGDTDALSSHWDAVINTVPAQILDADALALIPAGTLLMELASAPYGFNIEEANGIGLHAVHLPSLPAKYAPLSAASLLAEVIVREIGGAS